MQHCDILEAMISVDWILGESVSSLNFQILLAVFPGKLKCLIFAVILASSDRSLQQLAFKCFDWDEMSSLTKQTTKKKKKKKDKTKPKPKSKKQTKTKTTTKKKVKTRKGKKQNKTQTNKRESVGSLHTSRREVTGDHKRPFSSRLSKYINTSCLNAKYANREIKETNMGNRKREKHVTHWWTHIHPHTGAFGGVMVSKLD